LTKKLMLSLDEDNFDILTSEAERIGVSLQGLIRAVIIPDWMKAKPFMQEAMSKAFKDAERVDKMRRAILRRKRIC
jgi:hypothetical protein